MVAVVVAASCGAPATVESVSSLGPHRPRAPGPVVVAAAIFAAGPPGSTEPGAPALDSEASCADVDGREVCAALYDPHELDPEIDPVLIGSGELGQHYACYPGEATRWNGLMLVHFVGTGDDPARSHGLAEVACSLGFAAIVPMYKNRRDARSVCGNDSPCYEGMRREVLYGGDSAPDPIRVDAANSALHRLDTVLMRLATRETRFPGWATLRDRLVARDLSQVVVSGHSQGSGHALLLARDHEVERVVMLAGLSDRLNTGKPGHATVDWVAAWPAASKTPAARVLGYSHEDDWVLVHRQMVANYDVLGVGAASCAFAGAGGYPPACRRVLGTAASCGGVDAHLTVALRSFGGAKGACQVDGTQHSNRDTWTFLLTTPL